LKNLLAQGELSAVTALLACLKFLTWISRVSSRL
jgi:hypothetical protein